MFRKSVYIVETSDSARGIKDAVPAMSKLIMKMLSGEPVGSPADEGYIQRGVRVNRFHEKIGTVRAVDVLSKN